MSAQQVEVLRPKLKEAQRALEAALEEACDTDISEADTADLMRLEESLTAARDAAKSVIGILRHLHPEQGEPEETPSESHRVFVDPRGVQWDAFAVYPSQATTSRHALPAPYQSGWLALQCQEEIRRCTPIPEGWQNLPRDELCRLLETAVVAPRRTRPLPDGASQSEKGG